MGYSARSERPEAWPSSERLVLNVMDHPCWKFADFLAFPTFHHSNRSGFWQLEPHANIMMRFGVGACGAINAGMQGGQPSGAGNMVMHHLPTTSGRGRWSADITLVVVGVIVLTLLALRPERRLPSLVAVGSGACASKGDAPTAGFGGAVVGRGGARSRQMHGPSKMSGPRLMRRQAATAAVFQSERRTEGRVSPGGRQQIHKSIPASINGRVDRKALLRHGRGVVYYGGRRYVYWRTLRMRVTSYAPDRRCCRPYSGRITASGASVHTNGGHLVAADTALIPFHDLVRVPGYDGDKPVPVLDRGSAIRGQRLDVLLATFQAARNWGIQWVWVKVYQPAGGRF